MLWLVCMCLFCFGIVMSRPKFWALLHNLHMHIIGSKRPAMEGTVLKERNATNGVEKLKMLYGVHECVR